MSFYWLLATLQEFHEAGEQGNGVHSTLHNYLNVVIKSSFSFFPLLPDGQRSNLIFWGADQTFLQSINHKFGLNFILFFSFTAATDVQIIPFH